MSINKSQISINKSQISINNHIKEPDAKRIRKITRNLEKELFVYTPKIIIKFDIYL